MCFRLHALVFSVFPWVWSWRGISTVALWCIGDRWLDSLDLRTAAYLENREGGGQGIGGRHFTQGGRSTVVIGGTFRRNFFGPEGALRPEKAQAPSNYIFPVKTFAIGGRQTIVKGAFGAQGGMAQCPPCLRPCLRTLASGCILRLAPRRLLTTSRAGMTRHFHRRKCSQSGAKSAVSDPRSLRAA